MRLPRPLGLSGPNVWLPATAQTAEDAVAAGLVPADTAGELGYRALPVAELPAPEMAVRAARATLADTGIAAEDVALLLHAWIHYQGHDLWSPAHYIAHRVGTEAATPVGIQQVCNGGATAVELAATRLLADPAAGAALVTTGDRFADDGFDRWTGDYGIAYGDGATSLLVHTPELRDPDFLLHAVSTAAAPQLERMHRGTDAFGPAPRSVSPRVDVRRTKKAFLEEEGMEAFAKASAAKLHAVVSSCLHEGGLDGNDRRLKHLALPRLGRRVLEGSYLPALAGLTVAEPLDLGAETGHLGAGDAAANIAALHRSGLLDPGEYALVVSAGAGFTWSCLLLGRA